jgi:hypothetical protein
VLVTNQDPEKTAMAGESWGPPGTPVDNEGRWFDGRAVWKITFWAEPLTPGVAGSTVGWLPGLGLLVKSHGIAFMAGKGMVEVNGSGFSSTVLADGYVRFIGPEGITADRLHLPVWYMKV